MASVRHTVRSIEELKPHPSPATLDTLISATFGHLTVKRVAGINNNGREYVIADCDCGKTDNLICTRSLTRSHRSCGCQQMSTNRPEYEIWSGIRKRCNNPNSTDYHFYGGRGIRVCERWDSSFLAFYEDVGPRPSPKHSIDRIDPNNNYEPLNVRWSTVKEQRNNTRKTLLVDYEGKSWPLSLLADHLGLKYAHLYTRYKWCGDINLAIERMKTFKSRKEPNKPGQSRPERKAWNEIRSRCTNPTNKVWKHYGARGISMSEEWSASFDRFLADLGPRPAPGYSIERVDNSLGYCKENCRWATHEEQMNNTRSTTMVEFNGARQPLTPLCRQMGMPIGLVRLRLFKYGWTVERALTEPNHQKSKEDPLSKP